MTLWQRKLCRTCELVIVLALFSLLLASLEVHACVDADVRTWKTEYEVHKCTTAPDSLTKLQDVHIMDTMFFLPTSPVVFVPTAIGLGGGSTLVVTQKRMYNTTLVMPREQVYAAAYWATLYPNPFPKLNTYAAPWQASLPDPRNSIEHISPYAFHYHTFIGVWIHQEEVTYWADDMPPPGIPDDVDILPPTYCKDRSLIPPGDREDNQISPYFCLHTGYPYVPHLEMLQAVFNHTHLANIYALYFPPMLIIFDNFSLDLVEEAGLFAERDVVFVGPNMSSKVMGGSPNKVVVDMANLTGVISLVGEDMGLYMHRLTLTNLARLDLAYSNGGLVPVAAASEDRGAYQTRQSALPLWAFKFSDRLLENRVMLDSVNIILLQQDFKALEALSYLKDLTDLASARLVQPKGQAHLFSPVLDGITKFHVTRVDPGFIYVSSYEGWGVTGLNLVFQLDPSEVLEQEAKNSDADDGPDADLIIGTIVGVIGGLLLLLSLYVWYAIRNEHAWLARMGFRSSSNNNPGLPSTESSNSGTLVGIEMNGTAKDSKMKSSNSRNSDPKVNLSLKPSPNTSHTETLSSKRCGKPQAEDVWACEQQSVPASSSLTMDETLFDPRREVQQVINMLPRFKGDELILTEAIGSGASGAVYRAVWRNLDVAVKTVLFTDELQGPRSNKSILSPSSNHRVVREAALSSSVAHLNVVCTYHYEMKMVCTVESNKDPSVIHLVGGQPTEWKMYLVMPTEWKMYLVMELCHASLSDLLACGLMHEKVTKQPFLDLLMGVLKDVVEGVKYIHSKGIIHGDLKPGNVLLRHDANHPLGVVAKLSDFGLSCTMDSGGFGAKSSKGTPYFTAPEIISSGEISKFSDIYSLGVMMVQLYCGKGPSTANASSSDANDNPALYNLPPSTPASYRDICTRCMSQDPQERPSIEDIEKAMELAVKQLHATPCTGFTPAHSHGVSPPQDTACMKALDGSENTLGSAQPSPQDASAPFSASDIQPSAASLDLEDNANPADGEHPGANPADGRHPGDNPADGRHTGHAPFLLEQPITLDQLRDARG
eukprot:gene5360-5577_t